MADHKRNKKKIQFYLDAADAASLRRLSSEAGETVSAFLARKIREAEAGQAAPEEIGIINQAKQELAAFRRDLNHIRCDLARLGNLQKINGGSIGIFRDIRATLLLLNRLAEVRLARGEAPEAGRAGS